MWSSNWFEVPEFEHFVVGAVGTYADLIANIDINVVLWRSVILPIAEPMLRASLQAVYGRVNIK